MAIIHNRNQIHSAALHLRQYMRANPASCTAEVTQRSIGPRHHPAERLRLQHLQHDGPLGRPAALICSAAEGGGAGWHRIALSGWESWDCGAQRWEVLTGTPQLFSQHSQQWKPHNTVTRDFSSAGKKIPGVEILTFSKSHQKVVTAG